VAVIADAASERFFPKGAVVFREGEQVGSVHFVVQGALATVRRGARVGRAGPGAGVGGLAVFSRDPLGSQVEADEDTLTLELDRDAVAEVLEDRYPILHHILREMSRRAIGLVTRFRLDPSAGIPECPVDMPQSGEIDLVNRIFFLRRMSVFRRGSITALAEMAREMACGSSRARCCGARASRPLASSSSAPAGCAPRARAGWPSGPAPAFPSARWRRSARCPASTKP
jgi:CRP-like cAMP-binding protein